MIVRDNKKSIFESKYLVALFVLILVKPAYFGTINGLNTLMNMSCMALSFFLSAYAIWGIHITKKLIWILTYYGLIMFSTILNSGNIIDTLKDNIYGYSICMLFAICLEKSPMCLFESFYITIVYFFINFATVLAFPKGMYKTTLYRQNWFLGYKNPQIRLIIAFLCMFFLLSVLKNKKISRFSFFILCLSFITAAKTNSINGVLGIATWTTLLILGLTFPQLYKILNLLTAFGGYIIFLLFLFFVDIPQVIINILLRVNKRNSFLGRYQLWKRIINYINHKALFGYGYLSGNDFLLYTHRWWATHAHNWALNIMMIGGIALLSAFTYAVIVSGKSLNRYSNNLCSIIITATLVTYLLMGVDEAMTNSPMVYPIFVLAMDIDKIVKIYQGKECNKTLFLGKYTLTI